MRALCSATFILIASACLGLSSPARGEIVLFERAYEVDGDLALVMDESGFDTVTGLGTISGTATSSGGTNTGWIGAFFDHEIDEVNNTYFNEYAQVSGSPGTGGDPTSWEVDEPGWATEGYIGDIYWNFTEDRNLDNSIFNNMVSEDDVSMAIAWDNITLDPGQTATFTILLSDTGAVLPGSAFSITHLDADLDDVSITLSGWLTISGEGEPPYVIPEPSTIALLGIGVLAAFGASRRRKRA